MASHLCVEFRVVTSGEYIQMSGRAGGEVWMSGVSSSACWTKRSTPLSPSPC